MMITQSRRTCRRKTAPVPAAPENAVPSPAGQAVRRSSAPVSGPALKPHQRPSQDFLKGLHRYL